MKIDVFVEKSNPLSRQFVICNQFVNFDQFHIDI
jgi:hypothetical protein